MLCHSMSMIDRTDSRQHIETSSKGVNTSKIIAQRCPVCNGFGTLKYGALVCHGCNGKGYVMINTSTQRKVLN